MLPRALPSLFWGKNSMKKKEKIKQQPSISSESTPPKLVRRRENRHSVLKTGRTLSAKREHIETSTERIIAHQKFKKRQNIRILLTIVIFAIAIAALVGLGVALSKNTSEEPSKESHNELVVYQPTIEIIDEDSLSSHITNRMKEYIGQAEADYRELGLIPVKAVIPTGAIREVDFYLDGHPGFIKMILDRETAVSVEDASRMINYLEKQGISDYQYIDVRIPGKAYWK